LRAAGIELISNCFGGEQWSEHFTPSLFQSASAVLPFVMRRQSSIVIAFCGTLQRS
jgi:hypothetical protein